MVSKSVAPSSRVVLNLWFGGSSDNSEVTIRTISRPEDPILKQFPESGVFCDVNIKPFQNQGPPRIIYYVFGHGPPISKHILFQGPPEEKI